MYNIPFWLKLIDSIMQIPKMNQAQQAIILIGIIIAAGGLATHFLTPGTTRSGLMVQVDAGETATRSIVLDLANVDYFFGIELLPPGQSTPSNVTGVLLDSTNYNLYTSGTPLTSVDAILTIEDSTRAQYNATVTDELEFYVVIQNNGTDPAFWSYYYAVIPTTYYSTLTIGFFGVFVVLAGFMWALTGWKRFFVMSLSINVVLLFIRIFTLSNYSLGFPDIFWDLIHIEFYNDYQYFYLSWVPNMVEGTWPYSESMYYYIYPPVWIYSVSILGNTPSWLPGLILFLYNVLTGILVYKITQNLTGNEKHSIYAMLVYLLNPFTLLYGSFMWLNPTPFVFFMTLAFYFAQKEQEHHSVAALALATLCKQYAVVHFPILAILLIRRRLDQSTIEKLKCFMKHTLVYTLVIGLVSIPFLIVNPMDYVNRMILWNTGNYDRLTYFIPDSWMTVYANTFFLWLGFPTWFTDVIAILLINYVFIIISGIVVYGTYTFMKVGSETEDASGNRFGELFIHALIWSFIAIMCVQLFYPRGAYKFYLLALAPFFAILFDYKNLSWNENIPFQFHKRYLFPIIMSWVVLLCYRFVYFWILGLWMFIVLWYSGNLRRIIKNIKGIVTVFHTKEEPTNEEWDEIYSE
jgi:Gpi18-like mannosyltransferase